MLLLFVLIRSGSICLVSVLLLVKFSVNGLVLSSLVCVLVSMMLSWLCSNVCVGCC